MSKTSKVQTEEERNIEKWRVQKLIQRLELAKGNGTSMISLIIPPKDQITKVSKMLAEEYGTASNIKSRVNRLSVLGAITTTQQKLKLYPRVPENGLVIYCGTILTEEGKDKKVAFDFEPFRPINTSLYLCDNKFHTEPLKELLETDSKFGFIIMDGSGCLYGTLSGNTRNILHKFSVDLPKKHGRGGQSALRFARLRMEKRHNYLRKVAELGTQFFISGGDKPNISGLILAGLADFKKELADSDMFDQRLRRIILQVVDVSYGGENGFNQAIEMAAESLQNVKFVQEKKLLSSFMEEIARDTGKISIGLKETLYALEAGAVETLILWENLEYTRYVLKNPQTQEQKKIYLTPNQRKDRSYFTENGVELEVVTKDPLLEYFAEHYKEYGTALAFVTDRSQLGSQFVKGFGGVGGLLRYKFDSQVMLEADAGVFENVDSDEDSFDESESDSEEQHESEDEEEDDGFDFGL